MGCPYCGEAILLDARICKHCDRNVLYSVVLSASLDEKEKHQFIKSWHQLSKNFFKSKIKHISLSSYSHAKNTIDQIPFTLAWDLNQAEAKLILDEIKMQALEQKLQGGMPSTFMEPVATSGSKNSGMLYGILTLSIFTLGIYFFPQIKKIQIFDSSEKKTEASAKDFEALSNFEGIDPISSTKSPSNAKLMQPSNGIGKSEIEKVLSANVFIRDNQRLGSGFLISENGYILTNAHVTSDMETPFVVLHDGRQFEAKKIKENKILDVALIKISANNLDYLKLGDANELYPGQPVVAIGNPGGLSFTVTRGIVSYLGRNINGVPFIQTDAAINKGNSGGPMITENMEVVGINSLTSMNEQGISFALPINFVCASGGVASDILSSCSGFQGQQDPLLVAAQAGSPSLNSRTNYQQEADEYKEVLEREQASMGDEEARLKTKAAELTQSAEAEPFNMSLRDRIQTQLDELQKTFNQLSKRKASVQIRYLDQITSLLQRQKSDPQYSSTSAAIDQQLQKIALQRKDLVDFLNK